MTYPAPVLSGTVVGTTTADLTWTSSGTPGDPDFAYVSLLVQCNALTGGSGTGSGGPPDLSVNNYPIGTPSGAPFLNSTGSPFGGACFDMASAAGGSSYGTYLQVSGANVHGNPLYLDGDYTVEAWFYHRALINGEVLLVTSDLSTYFLSSTNSGGITAVVEGVSTTYPSAGIVTGAWNHIALVMQSNAYVVYVNGTALNSPLITTRSAPNSEHFIAGTQYGASFAGQIFDWRITQGVARYTANFTPPTAPFPASSSYTSPPPAYNVYRDAALIANLNNTPTEQLSYDDTPGGATHTYTVAAAALVPPGADESPLSNPVTLNFVTTATVPDLYNTSVAVVAPGLLAAAGLALGSRSTLPSGIVIAGNIISQSPAAGSSVPLGSAVNVVVSSGLPPLTIPDLFGLTQTEATELLISLGLVPGAISSAPSQFVPVGEVQAQSPSPGPAVAVGTIVSFILSTGAPVAGTAFDFEATVISQYANSPTIMQLVQNLNAYIDQSANFANFYNYVWNVDTAVGFGLDIWGSIVNVSRLLRIPNSTAYVGFDISSESQPDQDWTPAGSRKAPYNNPPVGGAMYTGSDATEAYLLPDDAYRQLILAKAFANICTTTAPAINQILQNLYGIGQAWVLNEGVMAISYNLAFTPSAIQLAILEQSGVIPTPPGVSVTINTDV
jgi:hypothetical protein